MTGGTVEPTPLEIDLLSLVLRLEQIDREETPEHWLWADRVMGCDVARMRRKWIRPGVQNWADHV